MTDKPTPTTPLIWGILILQLATIGFLVVTRVQDSKMRQQYRESVARYEKQSQDYEAQAEAYAQAIAEHEKQQAQYDAQARQYEESMKEYRRRFPSTGQQETVEQSSGGDSEKAAHGLP